METLKSSRFWITLAVIGAVTALAVLGKVDGQAVLGLIGGILVRPMVAKVPDTKDAAK